MRLLILADIHANWPALAAIQEPFDACLFVGDLVDYGTDPVPCVDWVRRHAHFMVRGNHDHAVAQRITVKKSTGLHRLAAAARPIHWQALNPLQMKFLTRMPVTRRVALEDKQFYLVHATPRDPFDEYLQDDKAAWTARLEGVRADFVLVGHTHIPYVLQLDQTTVINPGSVGQPRDGDPRASYALIENGKVKLRRVKYDIDLTLKQMRDCGVDAETIGLAEIVLRTGGQFERSGSGRPKRISAEPFDLISDEHSMVDDVQDLDIHDTAELEAPPTTELYEPE
jgi:putative phosphoesterase